MDIANELKELEERHLMLDVRASQELIGSLLADDFVEFGASGKVWSRADIIKDVFSEKNASGVTRSLHDFSVKHLAKNVALTTYRCTRQLPSGESYSTIRSSVWQQQKNGKWQMCFHQGTPSQ